MAGVPLTSIDFTNKDLYNPVYIPLLHNKKRYIFLKGGSGSGKSTFQAEKEIIKMYTPGTRLLALRKVKDTIKESVFAELVGIIEMWGLQDHFQITKSPMYIKNIKTGSDIVFRGMDDPEKIKSIRRVSRIWIEEATEFNLADFQQLDLRLRGQQEMQITCTFNPIDKEHWLNTEFWTYGITEDVELMTTTFLDNRWCGPEYKKVMDRLKISDPNMWKIYALGEWGSLVEGLIFKYGEIQDVPKDAEFLGYGQDFGYTNDPTTLIAVYRWNGKIILDEVIFSTGLTNTYNRPEEKMTSIVGLYEHHEVIKTKEIFADSAEPKSIEEIHRKGYNIKPVVKGPDSIMFGINSMKQYELVLTARSGKLKKEFNNYTWAKDKNGKVLNIPIDAFNHGIDAVRYFFMMRLASLFGKKTVRVLS